MKKRGILVILSLVLMMAACGQENDNQQPDTESYVNTEVDTTEESDTEEPGKPEKSEASNLVYQKIDMGAGINLGCALDSYDERAYDSEWSNEAEMYETLWGSSPITQADIDLIRDAGFGTVRIPVTYRNHIDENGIISEAWLARVKEIVDMVTGDGMYCVINLHHDTGGNGWMIAEEDEYEQTSQALSSLWTQIAEYFAEYDQKLVFEGYNELLNLDIEWNNAGAEAYEVANKLNQDFVDAVRSTGGNNATRFLLVNTYAASAEEDVVSNFVIPEDGESPHLIVGIHCYFDTDRAQEVMNRLNTYFVSNGIPVVLGEFGTANNNNDSQSRLGYIQTYLSEAQKYGIPCFWWDDGGNFTSTEKIYNFAILDRKNHTWYFPEVAEAVVEGQAGNE